MHELVYLLVNSLLCQLYLSSSSEEDRDLQLNPAKRKVQTVTMCKSEVPNIVLDS